MPRPRVAVIDYGLGNLYSVCRACDRAGMDPHITSSRHEILDARVVILPGVGAFGDAMTMLQRLDLVEVLRDVAASDALLVGVCLGMQLMMEDSTEFGSHAGLGILPGRVVQFEPRSIGSRTLKVPQVQWNGVFRQRAGTDDPWLGTPLDGIADGEYMYFVHSYYVVPSDASLVLSTSTYGGVPFTSSLRRGNVVACQFHPERSADAGLRFYKNIATLANTEHR